MGMVVVSDAGAWNVDGDGVVVVNHAGVTQIGIVVLVLVGDDGGDGDGRDGDGDGRMMMVMVVMAVMMMVVIASGGDTTCASADIESDCVVNLSCTFTPRWTRR